MGSSVLNATNSTFALLSLVARHIHRDWRCIDPENAEMNLHAVDTGERILSAYAIYPEKPCAGSGDNCLWIITEAARSVTTICCPMNTGHAAVARILSGLRAASAWRLVKGAQAPVCGPLPANTGSPPHADRR